MPNDKFVQISANGTQLAVNNSSVTISKSNSDQVFRVEHQHLGGVWTGRGRFRMVSVTPEVADAEMTGLKSDSK